MFLLFRRRGWFLFKLAAATIYAFLCEHAPNFVLRIYVWRMQHRIRIVYTAGSLQCLSPRWSLEPILFLAPFKRWTSCRNVAMRILLCTKRGRTVAQAFTGVIVTILLELERNCAAFISSCDARINGRLMMFARCGDRMFSIVMAMYLQRSYGILSFTCARDESFVPLLLRQCDIFIRFYRRQNERVFPIYRSPVKSRAWRYHAAWPLQPAIAN